MTISELVDRLERLKTAHGDIDVYVDGSEGAIFTPAPVMAFNIKRADGLGRIVKPDGKVVLL